MRKYSAGGSDGAQVRQRARRTHIPERQKLNSGTI